MWVSRTRPLACLRYHTGMTIADFRRLFTYSDNCRALLCDTLATHPDTLHDPFTTTSPFASIAALLAHSVGAEERWITWRIGGVSLPLRYEERAAPTLDGLCRDAQTIRDQTYAFLAPLSDPDLERPITMVWGEPEVETTFTVGEILFHILNHENYHRAQIVMELQRRGVDPPNFDYVLRR